MTKKWLVTAVRRVLRAALTCTRCGTTLNPVGECSYCDWMTR